MEVRGPVRSPVRVVNFAPGRIEPYCYSDAISFETIGDYQVLDLDFNPEDGDGWMEAEAGLSHFISLRADLLEGDYRLLYLAWLKASLRAWRKASLALGWRCANAWVSTCRKNACNGRNHEDWFQAW